MDVKNCKWSFFILLLFVLSLVGCSSKEKENRLRKATIHFTAGTQSLIEGDYTNALASLKKADELTPDEPEILVNLAMAYYFKNEKDIAIKILNRSLELKPEENSDAVLNLATIHYKDGDYDRAEALYKKVLKDLTYDKQARTYYNLGMLELEVRKNNVAADSYFKKAVKEDDNYCPAYFQLGMLRFKGRQFNSALRNFKEATMGTCTNSPAAHYYQGLALVELRRFTDARLKFDEIETKFKKSIYSKLARTKAMEISNIEMRIKSEDSHALKEMQYESSF